MAYPSDNLLLPLEIRKNPFLQHQAYAQNALNYNTLGNCDNAARNRDNMLLTQHVRPQHKIVSSTMQPPWENITFKYNPLHQDIDTIEEKTEFGESQINMNMYRTNDFENILNFNNNNNNNDINSNNNNNNIYLESTLQHNMELKEKVEPIPVVITTGLELFDTAGVCYGNFLKTQRLPTQTTIKQIQPLRKYQTPNPLVYKAKYKNLSLRNRPQTRAQTHLIQRPHTQQNFRFNNQQQQQYNRQQQQINQYQKQQQNFHQDSNNMNIHFKARRVLNQQQQQQQHQLFEQHQKQQQKLNHARKMHSAAYRNNTRNYNLRYNQKTTYRKQNNFNNNLNYYKKNLVRNKSKFKSVISRKILKIKEKNNDIEYCFLNCCNFLQSRSRLKLKFLKRCPCGTSKMKPESYYEVSYTRQANSTNDTDTNYNDKRAHTPRSSSG